MEERAKRAASLIKQDNLLFEEESFLKFTELNIENLHKMIREGNFEKVQKEISENAMRKLTEQKEEYRTTSNIDHINVQYAKLYDYIEEEKSIKVYMSIYFYDNTINNNIMEMYSDERYWNDVWIVTYKRKEDSEVILNCESCGATMNFTTVKNVLQCEYCGSKKYVDQNENKWYLDNIELLKY